MKRFHALLLLLLIPVAVFSAEVDFKKIRLEEAVSLAKKQDKNIFIDFMASWCGPCKWMSKEVFTDPAVAEYMNANFINLKIDVESELGESEAYAAFDVQAMPTLVFLTKHGKLAYRKLGALDQKDFLALAKKANDPDYQLTPLLVNYDMVTPEPDSPEALNLLAALKDAQHERYEAIWKEWREDLKEEQYLKDGVLQALYVPLLPFDSPEVAYLKANAQRAYGNVPEAQLTETLMTYVQPQFQQTVMSNDKKKLDALLAFVGDVAAPDKAKALQTQFELMFFQMTQDFDGLAEAAIQRIPTADIKDRDFLNNIAWTVYENVDNESALVKTASWFNSEALEGMSANEIEQKRFDDKQQAHSEYMLFDTYAALLLKAGAPKAREVAQATIAFAEAHQLDAGDTKRLLEQYK